MNRAMSEAVRELQVFPSCGCVFCDLDFKPVKMKRQWIHHDPKTGKLIVCTAHDLKPGS